MWHLQHKQSLLLGREIKKPRYIKRNMFKVLVEMSSWIGRNYKGGVRHASTQGTEGSDSKRQLSELPRGQSKVASNMNKKAGAEVQRTARLPG